MRNASPPLLMPSTCYNRSAAVALVLGFVAGLATMATHPTGRDVIAQASAGGTNLFNSAVHALALLGQALLVAGCLYLTWHLRARRDLAALAFVNFAFASVTIILAGAASGFLAPMSVRGIAEADEARRAAMLAALSYTGLLNQAFAKISVLFSCVAIALWSAAILIGREMSRRLGLFGLVLGTGLVGLVWLGLLPLDIHGFGFVVIVEGTWFTSAALGLWHADPA